MRIKKLKLVGFKSFVEPAELRIESGLTGIVGPNGCGKSNLLEAIRWVMGESSAKSMRGAGMEDVIFAGTASRPPRDFAEVTILAERSDDTADSDSDEELEVTRRIERGAGSAYRSNGRDVRAKDVALIFADAATGAHSPALVSQGRIGAIISAKPQERRQMLEEAAGISGLHVRRKDAEQKLRAAESNLARLATILADMDARAGQLRRQAKQAERYRTLTKDILQAEARLIFVRWREAKAAADTARADANTAAKAVEDAAVAQRILSEKQQEAVRQLADARAVAMAARDAASELSNKLVQLTGEHERIIQRQSDLAAQAARMAEDGAREGKLTHDAADALARLQAESVKLADEIKAQEEERPALLRTAENAERQARESEIALANASAEQARADAELRVADAALAAATTRVGRAEQVCARIMTERDALGDEAQYAASKSQADADVQALQTQLQADSHAHETAEAQRAELTSARDVAQVAIASAKAELAALLTEQSALQRSLTKSQGNKAIDRISVKPGYEHALAAALGEDADASIGGETGRRWIGGAAALGKVADTALIHFVDAPSELAARLSMVRVVETDDGQALAPGERLVTLAGRLRRWDGFATDGDGATIAEQLVRANRLAELDMLIAPAQAALDAQAQSLLQMTDKIAAAQDAVRAAAAARVVTEGQLRQALRAVDQAEDALARLKSAKAALGDRMAAAAQDVAEAQAERTAAETARHALPDGSHHADRVQNLAAAHDATRDLLARNQADLSALEQRLAQSRERRAVAMAEIRGWQERAGEAERRIAEMNKRSADIATEQADMAGRPEILAREIATMQADKAQFAEKLAGLQSAETAHETTLRALESEYSAAAEQLSIARETRAGAEARAENQEQRRVEMGRISGERFECPPPVLPEKWDFDEDAMDEAGVESNRLDRLQNERERIGPVNLIAADELAELEMQQGSGLAESEDLTLAINRLRGSIGSLNREGRARLLTAFEAVDGHFRRLFSTLFNGGQAHLALIDSDDPLEAGLEIFAQPPGKKLQSLTLLSGGEQALTAVALIFGLFLTNPAPICVLDEVDAPLDDANIERFCDLLDAMTQETETRYLIVTHNAVTMSRMHRLFGVTMVEQGISRLVSVDLGGAEQLLAAE
ncbi:MAG: AAA family ATPase [Sphingorhabdus sp.]|uniref:AAA family ATPase n=1 Tax=Sphingorhabdus sp. TaxID=1902408 RepID=UPI0025E36D51|nr:AAA family ATPase [Sphingorhabdus sp.]MCO4092095.1 AAA family ATPase [Sphingorhabdus sp.]